MLKKRMILYIFVILLCTLTLNGCRRLSRNEQDEKKQAGEQVTLELYAWEDERDSLNAVAQQYMEKYPNVIVNTNFIPTAEYGQGLAIALNNEKQVDLFCISKPSTGAVYVKKGQAIALDDFFESKPVDLSGYGSWFNGLQIHGQNYMMPYRMSAWVVYYNKTLFDRAGVDYPKEDWTWEDYAQIAEQLTDLSGKEPIYGSLSFDLTTLWWRIPARTAGAEDPMDPVDLLELKKAAEWCYDLTYIRKAQQPYTELAGVLAQDYNERFLSGKIGMYFSGEWSLSELNDQIKRDDMDLFYDVAPLPHWEGKDKYAIGTAASMLIATKSKQQAESYHFLQYMCGKEGASILAERSFLPAWDCLETRQLFSDSLDMPQHSKYFFQEEEVSQILPSTSYEEAIEIVHRNVKLYLMQEKSLEETFQLVEQELTEAGLR